MIQHRQILLIHESHTMRHILSRYLLSELVDVELAVAKSGVEGLSLLRDRTFHLVICQNEMETVSGVKVHEGMRRTGANRDSVFLLVTASPTEEKLRELHAHGIEHVLGSPFTPMQLSMCVENVCNPRQLRVHTRVHMPEIDAEIRAGDAVYPAHVLNVSAGGVLCERDETDNAPPVFLRASILLFFPEKWDGREIETEADLLRLTTHLASQRNTVSVRTGWRFAKIDEDDRTFLEELCARTIQELEAQALDGM